MKQCPNPKAPVIFGYDENRKLISVQKLGCKQWDCPYCALHRKNYYTRKAFHGVEQYKADGFPDWYFGTITAHKNWRGFHASLKNHRANWRKFYWRMKRAAPDLRYFIAPEKHADESVHVHLVSTCMTESRWWKDHGAASGLGFINENELIEDTALVAYYASKYVGKSIGVTDWPKNFRRIRFNIHWPEPPDLKDDSFIWSQPQAADDLRVTVKSYERRGFMFLDDRTGELYYETNARRRI